MISRRSSAQVEQVHEAVLRHLVLDQAQDQVGGRDRRLDAQQLEVLQVARVVAARDHALARRTSRAATWQMRMLSSSSPVTAITRSARSMPGALEHPQLGAVAVAGRRARAPPRPSRSGGGRTRSRVTSWPLAISSRARFQPTFPAPTIDARTSAGHALEPVSAADRGLEHARSRSGSDRRCAGPARRTSARGAGRARARRPSATLKRRLAICAITRFVLSPSVEATKASACSIPASSSASISSAVPTVNDPPRVLPALVLVALEHGERLGVLVEDGDLVPLVEHRSRDRRANAAAADDQHEHAAPQ